MLTSNLPKAIFDQALLSAASFLTTLLVARSETREGFGMFALAYAVLLISNSLLMAVILKPFTIQRASWGPDELRDRVGVYLSAQLAFSAAIGLVVCISATLAVGGGRAWPFIALGLAIPAVHAQELLRRAQLARLAIGRAVVYSSVFLGVQSAGLVGWLMLDRLTATTAFVQLCLSALVAVSIALRDFGLRRLASWSVVRAEMGRAWRFVRWSGLVTLIDVIEARVYAFVAAAIVGLSGPALLEVGRLILSPTHALVFPVLNLVMPMVAQLHGEGEWRPLRRMVLQGVAWVAGGVGLYALVLYWTAGPVLAVVYGGRYPDAAPVVRLFCVYYALAAVSGVASVCLEGMLRPRPVFFAQLAAVLVGLSVAWPALVALGPAGAVVGMIAGVAVGITWKAALLGRQLHAVKERMVVPAVVVPEVTRGRP